MFPQFRYHPDPVLTNVFIKYEGICPCCTDKRGWGYVGPIYCIEDIEGICPWCIADGRAAAAFDLNFIDGYGLEEGAAAEQVEELMTRTPGYFAPQNEEWPIHCGDFCALIGKADWPTVELLLAELETDMMALENKLGIDRNLMLAEMQRPYSPLWMHLFRCLTCAQPRLCADYE